MPPPKLQWEAVRTQPGATMVPVQKTPAGPSRGTTNTIAARSRSCKLRTPGSEDAPYSALSERATTLASAQIPGDDSQPDSHQSANVHRTAGNALHAIELI